MARQINHGAIHQLNGGWTKLDDVLRAIHSAVEAGEIHNAEHFVLRQWR